ncbi:MAG: 4Fe-4S binding protein [Chloroflexota bacterium]|nr:4Fe-4S binding protein [Chloroflexota bacterium]
MSHLTNGQTFADEVKAFPGGEHLEMCYSCGTCVSKCMIQQKGEPDFNPRRLLRMVMMEMKDEAFENRTTWLCSACDLCYEACPQEIHISSVINAVKAIAVNDEKSTFLKTAMVNQQTCVACGLCAEACPYEAITIVQAKVPYRGPIRVAKVDPGLCMACGVCAAVCRSTSIGIPEEYSDESVMVNIWDWLLPQGVEN